jgi:drug/metabolite transporter (DMT)-like permease
MHTTTGRWKLGLALALITAVSWGVLPVALKISLGGFDSYTVVWYRLGVSGLVLFIIMVVTRSLPVLRSLDQKGWTLLAIGLMGLGGNYVFYMLGLYHATPTITQTVVQLAPMFFLLGSLWIFKERFSRGQWVGFAVLIAGLLLFFNRRLPELAHLSGGAGLGTALIVLASIAWAAYGLAQKALLTRLGPQQILLLIYIGISLVILPWSSPGAVRYASTLELWMLIFACVNTLVAYGAFAEALRHWDASRIGAVFSIAPLITLATMWLTERLAPGVVAPEGLNDLSVVGALLVVAGSAACALGGERVPNAHVSE